MWRGGPLFAQEVVDEACRKLHILHASRHGKEGRVGACGSLRQSKGRKPSDVIAEIETHAEVFPRPGFDSGAEIEVEFARSGDDRALAEEVCRGHELGVVRRTEVAAAKAGGQKEDKEPFVAGEEGGGVTGEFVDVNTEILHDGRGNLSDLQTVGAEAIGCFRAPVFADIDRAAQEAASLRELKQRQEPHPWSPKGAAPASIIF